MNEAKILELKTKNKILFGCVKNDRFWLKEVAKILMDIYVYPLKQLHLRSVKSTLSLHTIAYNCILLYI